MKAASTTCVPPPFPTPLPPSAPKPFLGNVSPIQFSGTHQGQWNRNHTSSVGIVYGYRTIPTPWPILLAGLLISLFTSIISLVGDPFTDSQYGDHGLPGVQPIGNLVKRHGWAIVQSSLALYQTMRGLTAFIGVCKSYAKADGHFVPPSATICLVLSLLSAVFNKDSYAIARLFAFIGVTLAFTTLSLSLWSETRIIKVGFYGQWLLTNGTCPRVVGVPGKMPCPNQLYVGCGVDQLVTSKLANSSILDGYLKTQDVNAFKHHNLISFSEYILAWILEIPDAVLDVVFYGITIVAVCIGVYTLLCTPNFKDFFRLVNDAKTTTGKMVAAGVTILITLLFIAIFFPMHYVQQTKSASFVVQDGIGNLSLALLKYSGSQPEWQTWTGDGIRADVWSDFFLVQTPSDKLGFLGYWWNENGAPIWHKLALI